MDKTAENIKMCEKAEEIQANHKWEYGDWFIAEHGVFQIGTAAFAYDTKDESKPPIRSEYPIATIQDKSVPEGDTFLGDLIWLPRQDQLQEMVGGNTNAMLFNFIYFHVATNDRNWGWVRKEYAQQFASMEQLWLAFVMKEKYNKGWNGEAWVEA